MALYVDRNRLNSEMFAKKIKAVKSVYLMNRMRINENVEYNRTHARFCNNTHLNLVFAGFLFYSFNSILISGHGHTELFFTFPRTELPR